MANYALLVAHDTPGYLRDYDHNTQVLLEAKYCIPIFWLSFFRTENIVHVETEAVDDDDNPIARYSVPNLAIDIKAGRGNASRRAKRLLPLLPASAEGIYQGWWAFCLSLKEAHLQVDATELFAMAPETFEKNLRNALESLDMVHPDADALREVTGLTWNPGSKTLRAEGLVSNSRENVAFRLRGGQSVRKVVLDGELIRGKTGADS